MTRMALAAIRTKTACLFSLTIFTLCVVFLLYYYSMLNIVNIKSRFLVSEPTPAQRDYGHVMKFDRPDQRWNNTVTIDKTQRQFLASEQGRVFILGVVAKNSTRLAKWDKFAVYGQWYDFAHLNVSNLRCCFKYNKGDIAEQKPVDMEVNNYSPEMYKARLLLWHITCKKQVYDPTWISIARYESCTSENVSYMKPYYAMERPDSHMVINTKMSYGHINPEMVVSFLEAMRYFGVDKVITYVYRTLDPTIEGIFRYYAYIGVLDYYTIELADEARTPRKFPPLGPQYMSDEWLVNKDALERSIGSTYFGIFDMDEFLIPSKNRTYKALLRDLRLTNPIACHFFFQNVHFITDARLDDDQCNPNCSIFKRFVMTAPLHFNSIHEKMIAITSMVDTKTVNNHFIASLPGFIRGSCPNTEAYIRHYGQCKRKFYIPWYFGRICQQKHTLVKDTSMIKWSESTVSNIIQNTLNFLRT